MDARRAIGLSTVRRRRLPKLAIYALGGTPGAWAFYLGLTDQLGPEPISALERMLGLWALRFLLASLAVTPLRQIAGVDLLRYRRPLGLLAFFYAAAHLGVYVALDHGFAFAAIWADILRRPYVTLGMSAFIALTPLAITSNDVSIRRIGGAAWRKLHRLAYFAAVAAAAHFILVVKSWPLEPLAYAAATALLLFFRLARKPASKSRRTRAEPTGV